MSGRVIVVVGGLFGSEGKGAVAAHLSIREPHPLMAMRVAGPNAGHTVVANGKTYRFRSIPVAAAVRSDARLVIAAGSEIDPAVLAEEADWIDDIRERLYVDQDATVIDDGHQVAELGIITGTTGKGIGAARAARLLRQADLYGTDHGYDTASMASGWLAQGNTVLIEGTQGYGLGQHAGYYPHCTSSDCRAIDFLAMAGISPWSRNVGELEVWVVVRTHPIRIAGNSGPLKGETSWEALGVPDEHTTVTKKVRRVGEWDLGLVLEAVDANGGASSVKIACMFADYIDPALAGVTDSAALDESELWKAWTLQNLPWEIRDRIRLVGTGPDTMVETTGG